MDGTLDSILTTLKPELELDFYTPVGSGQIRKIYTEIYGIMTGDERERCSTSSRTYRKEFAVLG